MNPPASSATSVVNISRARRDQMPPGFSNNISAHFRRAEARAQQRLLAQLERRPEGSGPRCAYHVGHELVPVTQTRSVFCSTSPMKKTKQRTILKCPVPGCFYVASLPGEQAADQSEAA